MRTVSPTMASNGSQDEGNEPCEPQEQQSRQELKVAAAILTRVESHRRPLFSGHRPRHLGSARSPNGLRLSGARKGVRCSRGLGRSLQTNPSTLGTVEKPSVYAVNCGSARQCD